MSDRLSADEYPVELVLHVGPASDTAGVTGFLAHTALQDVVSELRLDAYVSETAEAPGVSTFWRVVAQRVGTVSKGTILPTLRTLGFLWKGTVLDAAIVETMGPGSSIVGFDSEFDLPFLRLSFEQWLAQLLPPTAADGGRATRPEAETLPGAIEALYYAWQAFTAVASLSSDDERAGNALAEMANELAKCDAPPRAVLRAAFDWFAHKADVFADAAAKAGGAAVGTTLGVGIGATASGQLPHLVKALETVRALIG